MTLPGSLHLKLYFFALVLASAAYAGSAPTLVANPSAIDIIYSTNQPAPQPVFVTITGSDGSHPAFTETLTPGTGTPSTLFTLAPGGTSIFQLGIDIATLNGLLTQPGQYTATVNVTSAGFPTLAIPVTLGVNNQLVITASPSQLTFNPPVGPSVQTISLTGPSINIGVTASTTTGGDWLSVSTNQNFTPATLTVTVNPLSLGTGTYAGSITVTPATGNPLIIPVSFQVGVDTITATPSTFTFTYNLGGTTPPAQLLQLSSTLANNTFVATASSSGNWLLVNGATANVAGTLPANLNVTVNPAGLSALTYQGTITIADGHGSTQTVTVTLAISGVGTLANPSAFSFVAQLNGPPAVSQNLVVTGFTNASFTAQSSQPWLTVTPATAIAPTQITLTANPTGLAAGTYTANLQIQSSLRNQNIPVTFTVSATPILTTSPGQILETFNGGQSSPATVRVNVDVTSGVAQDFIVAGGMPSWLQVTSAAAVTPTYLMVSFAPQSLASGIYLANVILVPASGTPVTVPVMLTVANATAIVSSVSSLTFGGLSNSGPQSQTIQISASPSTTYTTSVTTTAGGAWLSVAPATGSASPTKSSVSISVDATGLLANTYQGTVTFISGNGVTTPVNVTFDVGTVAPPTISPTSLSFAYTQTGTLPAAQNIQITGSQAFTASATTSGGGSWLAVTPTSGSGTASLSVSVNPSALAVGSYTGTITITPASSPAQIVAVTLTVSAPPTLSATPNSVAFAYVSGGTVPAAQTVAISSGHAAMAFTALASSSGWLAVTPASGTTPASLTVSVDTDGLGTGTYSGSIVLNSGSGAQLLSIPVTLSITLPSPHIDRVVNAASYLAGGVAPGELVSLFGSSLGPVVGLGAKISNGVITTTLGNVQVTFNGFAAPLLYVGAGQINAIVPYELTGASNVSIGVLFGSARSNLISTSVVSTAPGIFSADASGTGPGAILDLHYQLISTSNPAAIGDIVQIFATGQGQTSPAGVDGLIEPAVLPLPSPLATPAITIGGMPATIQYIGAAPGLVAGALQINAFIPPGVPSGPAQVVVLLGDNGSQTGLTIAIK